MKAGPTKEGVETVELELWGIKSANIEISKTHDKTNQNRKAYDQFR